jgi:5-carboxymethyl-2-hydroxymuconate isomerase
MPHLLLEHSANVTPPLEAAEVMPPLVRLLVELAGVDPANCKGRVVRHDEYHVGDGDPRRAFAHLELRLLAGRPEAVKAELGRRALAVLMGLVGEAATRLDLQVTVEVRDLDRTLYFKATAGSTG